MNLVTRCPACGTAFRVQRDQLAAHFGTVRCGKCGSVFNGVAALVEEGADKLSIDPSPQLGLFDPSRRPAQAARLRDEAALPDFMAADEPARSWTWLWIVAALAAAAALGAQAVYRYRAEIAAFAPEARAPLDAACRWLGCAVQLPRRADLMTIESSDLQADPRRDGLIVLHAVIRNRSRLAAGVPRARAHPDRRGRPAAAAARAAAGGLRRSGALPLRQGIAAGGEAALRVYLDSSRAHATSYRLYLFYPA